MYLIKNGGGVVSNRSDSIILFIGGLETRVATQL